MEIRSAKESDIFQLKRIWAETFGDSAEFIDWYFANRFFPRYSCCACKDGEIVSVCHTLPATVRLRRRAFRCAVLNGVSTLPKFRGRGIMREVLQTLTHTLYRDGFVLMSNTPADFSIYTSAGYAPVGGAIFPSDRKCALPPEVHTSGIAESADALFACYSECSPRYSGMLRRDEFEFERKCADWLTSPDARVFTVPDNSGFAGYAVFHVEDNTLIADEVLAHSGDTYRLLDEALHSCGLPVKAAFPPGSGVDGVFAPVHAMSIINAEELLSSFGVGFPASVRLTDGFFSPNNGIFAFGNLPSMPAVLSATAPQLISWLSGYVSLYGSGAELRDAEAAAALADALPAIPCFNTDNY